MSVENAERPSAALRAISSVEAGLVDRHVDRAARIAIFSGSMSTQTDVVADVGETRAGDEADVPRSNHTNSHGQASCGDGGASVKA